MTDIIITDDQGNQVASIYWDEVTNRLVMESTEGINLLSNNNGDITLTPTGTTTTIINGLYFPRNDGTHGQVMVTDGAGNLSFITLPTNTSISMSDLSDVKYPNGVDDGYLLVYSVADSAWVATVPPTTTMSLSDLDDVSYPNGVDNGYVLEYSTTDGGWIAKVPMSGTDISLEDLNDVAYPNGVDDGFILEYSVANSEWQAVQPPDYNVDLDGLNDVEITNPIQADTLQYDALTRMWKNIQPEAVDLNASLDQLNDVTITNVQVGQGIAWNGSLWVNTDLATGAVDSVFGRTGIITAEAADYDAFYANLASGALADTSLQPGDNITELTNDANYITLAQVPADAVSNVFGRTGAITAQASDYSSYYATVAQGALAETALQNGDNVSELTNDAGYITAADIPPGSGVASFNGRSGVVVPVEADYAAYFATNEQGALADTALQPNDNITELTNNANYITLAQVPADAVSSVHGRTGAVTAELSDYSLFYTQPGEDISVFNNDAGYITAADIPPGSGVASFNGRSGVVVPVETDYSAYFATNEQGVLASTAIQPNDNISELTNDSGYITAADIPPVPTAADVTYDNTASGLAATNVQAALDEIDTAVDLNTAARHTHLNKSVLDGITDAGSGQIITIQERTDLATAIQPGDNITELTNNANYITLAEVPADAPTDLTTGYASNYVFVYSSTGSDTTITAATDTQAGVMSNTDKITLDSALQSGDNVSELTNDSGYITLAEVPIDVVTSVFNRTGDVLATAGDYDAFYYTEAETDSQIAASMTAHVNAANPHPQYLTAEDLPETRPAWYTKVVSSIDPAFYVSANTKPTTPETSVSATGDITGVPVRLGQWMPPAAYAQAFDFYETALTFQYDIDCTTNDAEIYVEVWLRRAAGGEILLATGNRIPLTSDRQTYSGSLIIPGPVSIEVGDITFSRMYLNKTGGTDPTATLYMEGNNLTRMIITQPIPSYPAPHAFTHEVGGTDQIDHSQIAGAFGYKTHAEIDTELTNLSDNFANYLPLTGGHMSGTVSHDVTSHLFFDNSDQVVKGSMGITDIFSQLINEEYVIGAGEFSTDETGDIGLRLFGNYIIADTQTLAVTMPGAVVGSRLIATTIDQFGSVLLGWAAPPVPDYTVVSSNDQDVLIGTGATPTAWVQVSPTVVIEQDVSPADSHVTYVAVIENLTTRTGTVELGFSVNGADPNSTAPQYIAANSTTTLSGQSQVSVPLAAGTTFHLVMRVLNSSNPAFLATAKGTIQPTSGTVVREGTGGGSSVTSLAELDDVVITSPANGEVLTYEAGKWVNQAPNADIIQSVFGRTGFVTAQEGDYAAYYAPTTAVVYAEDTVQVVTTPSSVNIANGGFLTYTATGANTWNFTVPSTAGKAIGWTLELTNGGTGVQTFTGVTWAAGSAPTLVASGVNVLVFTKNNVTGVIRGYVAA